MYESLPSQIMCADEDGSSEKNSDRNYDASPGGSPKKTLGGTMSVPTENHGSFVMATSSAPKGLTGARRARLEGV